MSVYENLDELEDYLNLPAGSLRQIPAYARKGVAEAILKVRDLENRSIFRPGLYYIVLTDLCANTEFNSEYGDSECDLRTEWFHTAAIEAIGRIDLRNYIALNKTIGDASLLIFSSFQDVFDWSEHLTIGLHSLSEEYARSDRKIFEGKSEIEREQLVEAFRLRARRLVHLGEVSYKEHADPLCMAVSQTFTIEKNFSSTDLGCTQVVADAIKPKLSEMAVRLFENRVVSLAGIVDPVMTYYIRKQGSNTV
jgi:hypothetical protein